ncbi:MAG: hypothetical protein M1286_00545 [Candidatus Marsarchaeota archaeon]|nr:hypothetical protein [Candidatus Marsarchaeota archaeon]
MEKEVKRAVKASIIAFIIGVGLLWAAWQSSLMGGADVWLVADIGYLALLVGFGAGLYAWLKHTGVIK